MKTKISSLLLATLLISSISFAKVWRVNNNPGASANFTTANDAMLSSSVLDGDTIYFEASNIDYSTFQGVGIYKQLTLIGTGYFLGTQF